MDLIKINPVTYTDGEFINGWDSITWVERYSGPGEVTITAPPDPDIQAALWPGTMVTHIDSKSVMMIETHMIDEDKEGEPVLEMTGRTVDVIAMENRVLTMEDPGFISFINGFSEQDFAYDMVEGNAWDQATKIINDFLVASIINPYETYPNLLATCLVEGNEPIKYPQSFSKGTHVDKAVYDLLGSVDKGLRLERPTNSFESSKLKFVIHGGEDLTNTVQFDWAAGDVEKARYVWSNKNYKNGGYIFTENFTRRLGRNLVKSIFGVLYQSGIEASGWDLKMTSLNVDWDLGEVVPPASEIQKTYIGNVLAAHGNQELAKRKQITLLDASISPSARYEYIHDYNIGDIVNVRGNYGVDMDMRIVEFAITADSDGENAFPTLEAYLPENAEQSSNAGSGW